MTQSSSLIVCADAIRMPVDSKALQILTRTFWSSRGWRMPPLLPSPEAFAYARSSGLMFDPRQIPHDELAMQIRGLVRRISVDQVVEAFVSSLSSRRLDLRSALARYVIGRALPIHSFRRRQRANVAICGVCGIATFVREPADWNRSASSDIAGAASGCMTRTTSRSTSSSSRRGTIQWRPPPIGRS